MASADVIVSWFIRNVLFPGSEVIDQPGFVIDRVTGKGRTTLLRDVIIPEHFFVELESEFVTRFGQKGHQALYSTGKKFGFAYASLGNFPTITTSSKLDFEFFSYFLVRYIEAMYARKLEHRIDYEKKVIEIDAEDYVVCKRNGIGHLVGDGGIGGIWAFMIEDPEAEGTQTSCSGRGTTRCHFVCGPREYLHQINAQYNQESNPPALVWDSTYARLNQQRQCDYAKNSLKNFVDSGVFEFAGGVLSSKGERYFYVDANIIYFLEEEARKVGAEDVLFTTAFTAGEKIGKAFPGSGLRLVTDLLPAFGFGDVVAIGKGNEVTVSAQHYPWSSIAKNSTHVFFRGFVSGVLSTQLSRRILLTKAESFVTESLSLSLSE